MRRHTNREKTIPPFRFARHKDGATISPQELCAMMDYILLLEADMEKRRGLPKQLKLPLTRQAPQCVNK